MKTITKKIKVYEYSELSEDAKRKAIDNLSDINVNYDWWNSTYRDAEEIGLKIDSFDLERHRHCKGNFTLSANEVAQNIFNQHGDMCQTFKTAKDFMFQWEPIFADYMNEDSEYYESKEHEETLQGLEDDFLNSLLEDYSIILQNECDYLQSEESIIETIDSNEYTFLENGTIYNI